MGSKAALIQPATLADASDIAELQMHAFCDDYFNELFPAKDGLGLKYSTTAWTNFISASQKASSGIHPVVYIIRGEDGKLLSTALYYIIPPGYAYKDQTSWRTRWGPPLPGMKEAKLADFFETMGGQHNSIMADKPHFCYGSALLKHGNKMADEQKMACYLDAEADAMKLYETVGYVHQKEEQISPFSPMMRPATTV